MTLPGYLICIVEEVTDPEALAEYRKLFPETVIAYGGERVIGAAQRQQPVEGEAPVAILMFKFPTYEAALAWHSSPEYQPLLRMRQGATKVRMTVAEGLN